MSALPGRGSTVSGSGTQDRQHLGSARGRRATGSTRRVAVEFAAAYASGCEAGPIVVGHDGRVSAAVFVGGRRGRRHGDRPRRRLAPGRPRRRPSAGSSATRRLAGGIQISASHNPPKYNGLKFFQRAGMVLGAARRGAPCSTAGSVASFAGRAGTRWARRSRASMIPIRDTWRRCSRSSIVAAIRAAGSRSCSTPATGPAGGWGRRLLEALGAEPSCSAASPTAGTIIPPSRREPTSERVCRRSSRRSGRRSVSPRTPMPTGWRSSTRRAATSARS